MNYTISVITTANGCASAVADRTVQDPTLLVDPRPNGTYYLCVSAHNAYGTTPASNDGVAFTNAVPIDLEGSLSVSGGDGANTAQATDLTVGKNLSISNGTNGQWYDLLKTGPGTLALAGANTFAGGTIVAEVGVTSASAADIFAATSGVLRARPSYRATPAT